MNRLILAGFLVVAIAVGLFVRLRSSSASTPTRRMPFYGTVASVRDDGWLVCDFTHRKQVPVLLSSRFGDWSPEWMRENLVGKSISIVTLVPKEAPEEFMPETIICSEATIDGEHKARPLNYPSGRLD